ncbi:MAG: ATP-dependent Clp protease ATP-binding subunit [bacterium]|nr:ATP-dependent Clp protease ATP-binding subunit [bacterium]
MQPEKLIENFSSHLKSIIARSISLASSLNYTQVSPLHILYAVTEETGSIASEILYRTHLEPSTILEFLEASATKVLSNKTFPELNKASKSALEKAMLISYEKGHNYIGSEHLLHGLLKVGDKEIIKILKDNKIKVNLLFQEIETIMQSTAQFPDMEGVKNAIEDIQDLGAELFPSSPTPPSAGLLRSKKNKNSSAILMFTTNLTDKNNADNFDPIIGRERELERLINILSRRTKNNPVLVGEPGVGKTAIVEGLAKKIVHGDVPDILKNKKILSLDLTLLIAGTIYRGEFESRLKQIIDEVSAKPDYILFIDEIHNIIGAGSNQGTMDAANILKPALSRGMLRCIGATTIDEYKKHISSDPALERRFQSINVEEPSAEETIRILNGIKRHYEDYHNVTLTDDAINSAVELSNRFVHDNFLPDKAIDLIDEASANVRASRQTTPAQKKLDKLESDLEKIQNSKEDAIKIENFDLACDLKEGEKKLIDKIQLLKKQLTKEKKPIRKKVNSTDIAKILSQKVNIPIEFLLSNEWDRLEKLNQNLKTHIIGQDFVVDKLSQALSQSYIRLSNSKKPFASFLFAGPSGVGKTEMAKVLARELFMDERALIRLDMSEFAEAHSVSKLLGSPAGYVGYKERNRFTDDLKKKPYAVILFDEFDKAHSDVQKLLLQILDEGELTDGQGKKIHLRHSIIVLTTNVGSDLYKSAGIGFGGNTKNTKLNLSEEVHNSVISKLKEELGNSLFSRIQTTCLFSPLSPDHVKKIIEKNLKILSQELQIKQAFKITPDDIAITELATIAYSDDTGVRNADNVIQDCIYNLIVNILKQQERKNEYILTKQKNGYILV